MPPGWVMASDTRDNCEEAIGKHSGCVHLTPITWLEKTFQKKKKKNFMSNSMELWFKATEWQY